MKCDRVRETLPGYVREGSMPRSVARHVARCEECSVELERYEILLGSLAELRSSVLEPPAELRAALVGIPSQVEVERSIRWRAAALKGHVARNRGAYLGGAVAVAGAALWRTRARRLATA